MVLLSLVIATVFALLNPRPEIRPVRYFFVLLGYMVVGSLLFAWLMYFLPL